MTYLTKGDRHVIHQSTDGNSPRCGGGHQAKTSQWQTDIGPANCQACDLIARGQNNLRQRRPRPDMPVI